ncbi:MAG TPA: hypothetical protein VLY22_01105 [Candidatus Nitrosotalea sp.]|nr:hypothetical protein [Candidatus Nitrosotalea sp.]
MHAITQREHRMFLGLWGGARAGCSFAVPLRRDKGQLGRAPPQRVSVLSRDNIAKRRRLLPLRHNLLQWKYLAPRHELKKNYCK